MAGAGGPPGPFTFYEEDEAGLAEVLAEAPLDAASLARPLRACARGACRGLCCHDGVYLSPEAAQRVAALVAAAGPAPFATLGLTLPDAVVVQDASGAYKTATVPDEHPPLPGRPAWFPATRCVFRAADGSCALQHLSVASRQHPWYFKPTACWLHPLSTDRAGRPVVWLPSAATDPHVDGAYRGYASATPCGAEVAEGPPAAVTLDAELALLGDIVGRDYRAEAAAWRSTTAS